MNRRLQDYPVKRQKSARLRLNSRKPKFDKKDYEGKAEYRESFAKNQSVK